MNAYRNAMGTPSTADFIVSPTGIADRPARAAVAFEDRQIRFILSPLAVTLAEPLPIIDGYQCWTGDDRPLSLHPAVMAGIELGRRNTPPTGAAGGAL